MPEPRGRRDPKRETSEQSTIDLFTEKTVDAALLRQGPLAVRHVSMLLEKSQKNTRALVLKKLQWRLRVELAGSGFISGVKTAVPGSGSAILQAANPRQKIVDTTVFYILAAAEAHGIAVSDLEDPRDLLWPVLLALDTDTVTRMIVEHSGKYWSGLITKRIPRTTVARWNTTFGPATFVKHRSANGKVVVAEVVDGGIGGFIGGLSNFGLAHAVIFSSQLKFANLGAGLSTGAPEPEPVFEERAEEPVSDDRADS